MALNHFLRDIYSDAKILSDRVVPRELVYSCRQYRRQMRGLQVPRNVYIAVIGSDLLRLNTGEFVVLEDNLRVPSGVSYMRQRTARNGAGRQQPLRRSEPRQQRQGIAAVDGLAFGGGATSTFSSSSTPEAAVAKG